MYDTCTGWSDFEMRNLDNQVSLFTECLRVGIDCKDSIYPSDPLHIVKDGKVVRETKGRGEIKIN